MSSKAIPDSQCQPLISGSPATDFNGTGRPRSLKETTNERSSRGSDSGRAASRRLATKERLLQGDLEGRSVQGGPSNDAGQVPVLRRDASDSDVSRQNYVKGLCPKHSDPRLTSVADPASAPCTCYQGPAECPVCHKRHAANHPHRNERVCTHCGKPKNKRTEYRDHNSEVCSTCTAIAEADEDARWNAKTDAEHAADGDRLFAKIAARYR